MRMLSLGASEDRITESQHACNQGTALHFGLDACLRPGTGTIDAQAADVGGLRLSLQTICRERIGSFGLLRRSTTRANGERALFRGKRRFRDAHLSLERQTIRHTARGKAWSGIFHSTRNCGRIHERTRPAYSDGSGTGPVRVAIKPAEATRCQQSLRL